MAECLFSKNETLNSNSSTAEREREKSRTKCTVNKHPLKMRGGVIRAWLLAEKLTFHFILYYDICLFFKSYMNSCLIKSN
jgi:hypothetical protein